MKIIQSAVVTRFAVLVSSMLLLAGCADTTSVDLGENIRPIWLLESDQQTRTITVLGRVIDAYSNNTAIQREFETLIRGQELASLYSASDPINNEPMNPEVDDGVRLTSGDWMRAIYGSGSHQLWRREALFNYRTTFGLNESLTELELRLEFAKQRLDTLVSQVSILDVSGFTLAENGSILNPLDTINLSWNIGDVVSTEPATLVQYLRVSLERCESGPVAVEDIFFSVSSDARSASLSVSDFPAHDSIGGIVVETCQFKVQVLVASVPDILFTDAAENRQTNEEPIINPVVASLAQSVEIGIQVTYGDE